MVMDQDLRAAERAFQQEETISNLVALMRARVKAGNYSPQLLRIDNRSYRRLLGQNLVNLMDSPQIIEYDYISYTGRIEIIDASVTAVVDLNPSKELSIVSMHLPNKLTYDLVCPPSSGQLMMMIYGLDGRVPKEEMYAPGEVPFGSGLELCEHMFKIWKAKEAYHGR